jgi:transposase
MTRRQRPSPKVDALRERGILNPHPEHVKDERFQGSEFFDARDMVQLKYEMLRKAQLDSASVAGAAKAFGLSRPSFYTAQAAFNRAGLAGLLPRKRGPRGGHKLSEQILQFVEQARARDRALEAADLVPLVHERFGVKVHARSIRRALIAREKKRH